MRKPKAGELGSLTVFSPVSIARLMALVLLGFAARPDAAEVKLSWRLPTGNEDGTPLTDLAGCRVYWGLSSSNYTHVLDLPGAVTNCTVTGLQENVTYFLNGTAYNSAGAESDFSAEVARTPPYTTPLLIASRTNVTFSAVSGATSSDTQTVQLVNGGTSLILSWTQSDNAPWLLVTPSSGTTPGRLRLSVVPTGLAVGTYTGTVTVSAPSATNSPQRVSVSLTIVPPPSPSIGLAPSAMTFAAVAGGVAPAAQTLGLTNGTAASPLSWIQSDDASWLQVTPAGGTTPSTLTVTANTTGLAIGTYTAAITITAPGASNSPRSVPVTLVVSAAPALVGAYRMDYGSRQALLLDGWDFMARTAAGEARNTEQTAGAVVSFDQGAHPGRVRIPTDAGDLWNGFNDTRNSLFRDLPASWTSVRMKLAAFNPALNYQQAGLVIYQDDDNYVQVSRVYENGNRFAFGSETDRTATWLNYDPSAATTNLYMRLDRGGTTVAAFYGFDGSNWTSLGTVKRTLVNPRLGIITGASPGGYPTADIEWVEVYALDAPPPESIRPAPPTRLRHVP